MTRIETVGRIWAVSDRILGALADLDGRVISNTALEALEAAIPDRGAASLTGSVATIPLKGTLMGLGGGDLLSVLFGGGLQEFEQQLRSAAANPDVRSVVLDIDSPGGLIDHIPELAADVRAAAQEKPVVAVANPMAASAAYWLASQATQVVVTPSGEAGSIGVYQLHRDMSEAHAMRGIKPTLISAGKYKVEGNPYEPLSDEARAQAQQEVDDLYDQFTADVAKGRGVSKDEVRAGFGQGRALLAKRAVSAGVADRIGTLEETVRRLNSPRGHAAVSGSSAHLSDRDVQRLLALRRAA